LTGTKHAAFSTNHLADIDNTKLNYNQEKNHKNLNNHAIKVLVNAQIKANETKAWFSSLSCHSARKSYSTVPGVHV